MEHIIKVNHTVTPIQDLKSKIRIITISDIHYGQKMSIKKINRVFNLVDELNPDYICLLGDNIDTTNAISSFKKRKDFLDTLKRSGQIAPTLIGLADHDMRYCHFDGHISVDVQNDFWDEVDDCDNLHVLDNTGYEDEKACFFGYTLPNYYYHAEYSLPKNSCCSTTRKDEDVDTLVEDMEFHKHLFKLYRNPGKYNAILFHSPQNLCDVRVASYLRGFDHIYSGHMHEGCMPPILDEVVRGNIGLISPQRELFPKIARGIIKTSFGTICIINGGITKIHESANPIFQPMNHFLPMHIDVIDVMPSEQELQKEYIHTSKYRYLK